MTTQLASDHTAGRVELTSEALVRPCLAGAHGGEHGDSCAAVAGHDPRGAGGGVQAVHAPGRGLRSFTFQLNISAFCGIGGALRCCSGGVQGYFGVFGLYFVSGRAQVELKSGRVSAPGARSMAGGSCDACARASTTTCTGARTPTPSPYTTPRQAPSPHSLTVCSHTRRILLPGLAWPDYSFPDCLLAVYLCACAHTHPPPTPPWPCSKDSPPNVKAAASAAAAPAAEGPALLTHR